MLQSSASPLDTLSQVQSAVKLQRRAPLQETSEFVAIKRFKESEGMKNGKESLSRSQVTAACSLSVMQRMK